MAKISTVFLAILNKVVNATLTAHLQLSLIPMETVSAQVATSGTATVASLQSHVQLDLASTPLLPHANATILTRI